MKILITGGSSLLGQQLSETLEENNFDVFTSFYNNAIIKKNCFQMDITKKDEVLSVLKKISPNVVIHTAAYTNVDGCEKNKEFAFNVNVQGTVNIANAAEKLNSKFVYISTDYVFNGKQGRYKEDDETNPIDYYGVTKLKGEKYVRNICSNYVIARPSVIYGNEKKNFVTWVIDMLKNKKKINIVTDQFVSPTLNIDLSEQLLALLEKDITGVFHTAGGERISRYDFVKKITEVFNLKETFIKPITMEDLNWIAQRPKDSSLNISKISKLKKPYPIKKSLMILKEKFNNRAIKPI